jgi:hypothetical protein
MGRNQGDEVERDIQEIEREEHPEQAQPIPEPKPAEDE